ncbi:MAG: FecR domain-containing protein [Rhizobacter sp.]|nr:FecR domain-containing protein [Bacteriovorax sp.]
MNSKLVIVVAITTVIFTVNVFASENVAKVVIMRGQVKAKLSDGSVVDVKTDQSLPEGATLQTADKSFVKLLFIDKSQMNLGPNSQMVINAFPKKEAGIITLVKGQIRSQVTKDYMEMDDKNKSKLYIKTKTAAMGIRGTDFQVNYNPENQNTALITFEGKVAMAHIGKDNRNEQLDQGKLEKVVSSDKAVMVTQGQISAVNLNVAERAMVPTKLGTKQIVALEGNETGLKESTSTSSSKQFRNPIPPGADGAAFSNSSTVMDKEISKMGVDVKASQPQIDKTTASSTSNPEGFFNVKTGEYKLPAGSIVDLATVNIIPPPTNAVFDKNSGTFTVPETFGKIDKSTGEYKAPVGLALGTDGQFKVIDAAAYQKAQAPAAEEKRDDKNKDDKKKADDRTPASTGDTTTTAAPAPAPAPALAPPSMFAGRPEMAAFVTTNAVVVPAAATAAVLASAPVVGNTLQSIADDQKKKTEILRQTASETGAAAATTSKVKFIFDAQ